MSKYYGSMTGYHKNSDRDVKNNVRGFTGVRTAARTYEGSLITVARDDDDGGVIWELEYSDETAKYGDTIWSGRLEELVDKLKG